MAQNEKLTYKGVDLPEGFMEMGREQKKAFLLENNLITAQELQDTGYTDASLPVGDVDVFDTVEKVGDWTLDNMDVVAPAVAGVVASMMTKGAAAPIAASSIAAAGSKYYADTRKGVEPSMGAAGLAAAESIGIDLATVGLAKVGMPMLRMLGFSGDEATDLIEHANKVEAMPPGTQESLRQTQSILRQSGRETASLSASQTGNINTFLQTFENVVDNAPITGARATERHSANNLAIQDAFNDLIRDSSIVSPGPNALGVYVDSAIKAGKKALSTNYVNGLNNFSNSFGRRQIEPDILVKELEDLKKGFQIEGVVLKQKKLGTPRTQAESSLTAAERAVREKPVPVTASIGQDFDREALKILNEHIENFGSQNLVSMPVSSLIALEKSLRNQIAEAGNFTGGSATNTRLETDLTKIADAVQRALEPTLQRVNPKAAEDYAALKKAYGDGLSALVPPVDLSSIRAAGDGYFEAIGRTLVQNPTKSQVEGYIKSVRQTYSELIRAGQDVGSLAYKNADEAIEAMRNGYVKNLMPNLSNPNFDINDYKRLATESEKPAVMEVQKTLMGEDYARFKALLNALSDAGSNDGSMFGTLILNSKVASAGSNLLTGAAITGGAGMVGGGLGAMAAGLSWLTAPAVLQRIVSNPKAVNTLLFAQNQSKTKSLTPEFLASAGAKVFAALSDEDKAYIQNLVRQEILGPTKAVLKTEDVLSSRYGQEGVVRYRPTIGM
tara:strand:+ start:1477 stop:3657 length:2181 start_codon:yes stop_codon:yes gene_type:complete